jgi:transposase-like protein
MDMTDTARYICPDCGRPVSQATGSPDRGKWRHGACIRAEAARVRPLEAINAARLAARAEQDASR